MNSKMTKQLNELGDLCDVLNSISHQNEIENLKTTNEKLADNLKIVNDDKTKQEEKHKLKIPNTDVSVTTFLYCVQNIISVLLSKFLKDDICKNINLKLPLYKQNRKQ